MSKNMGKKLGDDLLIVLRSKGYRAKDAITFRVNNI